MNAMLKRWVLVVGVLLSGAGFAADGESGWRGFLVGGLTKGGDSMFTTVTIGTGATQHLYAGNLLQIGAGALWTANNWPVALGLSVNYHIDDSTGASESVQFKRVPLEAIGYYLSENKEWRAGFGLRYVTATRLEANFPNSTIFKVRTSRYKDAKGLVAETGWAFGPNIWVNFRAVKELYEETSRVVDGVYTDMSGSEKINGSHIGVNLLYAF